MQTQFQLDNYIHACTNEKHSLGNTHSTGGVDYYVYLCLSMQIQFQLGSYIYACTNKAHSLAKLQDFILTFAGIVIGNTK